MSKEKALNLYQEGSKDYRKIYSLYHGISLKDLKGFHIHHLDGNHNNNHPDNLLKCTPEEHAEFHKAEGLFNFINLQQYAAKKGGYVAGKKKDASKQMKKVWEGYTAEQKEQRLINLRSKLCSDEYRKNMSSLLKGKSKPVRKEDHTQNFKVSKSIGMWTFDNKGFLSSWELASALNIPTANAYKWCKTKNCNKITIKLIQKYPQIFNINDLNKTFNEKGFKFTKKENYNG